MRKLFVMAVLLSIFVLIDGNIFAQNRQGNRGRNERKVVVVKKGHPHRYHRKNVVIVRKRNGRTLAVLPNGYATCVYKNNNYYYHGGFFYRNLNKEYHLIAPPFGLRMKVLPAGYRKIIMFGQPHYFYQGVFYKQVGNEYETVQPQVGTIVQEIPQEMAEQVQLDGISYYEIADFLYKPVQTPEGPQYEVAGQLDDESE